MCLTFTEFLPLVEVCCPTLLHWFGLARGEVERTFRTVGRLVLRDGVLQLRDRRGPPIHALHAEAGSAGSLTCCYPWRARLGDGETLIGILLLRDQ